MKTIIKGTFFLFMMVAFPVFLIAQSLQVGKVTDLQGNAIEGATIRIKGTSNSTKTDATGGFRIVLRRGDVIVSSSVGFKTKETIFQDTELLSIRLEADQAILDDVVVVGYGSQTRQELTGAVSTLKMEEITENQVAESFESMMQGRVAGVNIQLNSGEPGATPNVIIRGLAAVSRDDGSAISEPLYVVDGIPIISRTSDEFSVTSTNVLADLNPSDIEEVTVLKDAYAAAIYGSRAANGVILITTKK